MPRLCARVDVLLAGQADLLAETEAIERFAQRHAASLIAIRASHARLRGIRHVRRTMPAPTMMR